MPPRATLTATASCKQRGFDNSAKQRYGKGEGGWQGGGKGGGGGGRPRFRCAAADWGDNESEGLRSTDSGTSSDGEGGGPARGRTVQAQLASILIMVISGGLVFCGVMAVFNLLQQMLGTVQWAWHRLKGATAST